MRSSHLVALLLASCAPETPVPDEVHTLDTLEESDGEAVIPLIEISTGDGFVCGRDANALPGCWLIAPVEPGYIPCVEVDAYEARLRAESVRSLAAGAQGYCAIGADGRATCLEEDDLANVPDERWSRISVGDGRACGLTAAGAIRCWGLPSLSFDAAKPGPYIDVEVGEFHVCGLRPDGGVDCWGETKRFDAELMNGPYTDIAGTCGLRVDSTISCWEDERRPLGDTRFRQFDAGRYQVCGVMTSGAVDCEYLDAGYDSANVAPIPESTDFVSVSLAPEDGACGLHADGTVSCWAGRHNRCFTDWSWHPRGHGLE